MADDGDSENKDVRGPRSVPLSNFVPLVRVCDCGCRSLAPSTVEGVVLTQKRDIHSNTLSAALADNHTPPKSFYYDLLIIGTGGGHRTALGPLRSFADLQKPQGELTGKACAAVGQSSLMALYDIVFSQQTQD